MIILTLNSEFMYFNVRKKLLDEILKQVEIVRL